MWEFDLTQILMQNSESNFNWKKENKFGVNQKMFLQLVKIINKSKI